MKSWKNNISSKNLQFQFSKRFKCCCDILIIHRKINIKDNLAEKNVLEYSKKWATNSPQFLRPIMNCAEKKINPENWTFDFFSLDFVSLKRIVEKCKKFGIFFSRKQLFNCWVSFYVFSFFNVDWMNKTKKNQRARAHKRKTTQKWCAANKSTHIWMNVCLCVFFSSYFHSSPNCYLENKKQAAQLWNTNIQSIQKKKQETKWKSTCIKKKPHKQLKIYTENIGIEKIVCNNIITM